MHERHLRDGTGAALIVAFGHGKIAVTFRFRCDEANALRPPGVPDHPWEMGVYPAGMGAKAERKSNGWVGGRP